MNAEWNEYVCALQLFVSYTKDTVYSWFYHLTDCFYLHSRLIWTPDASISAGNVKCDISALPAYYFTAFWRFCALWFRKRLTTFAVVWVNARKPQRLGPLQCAAQSRCGAEASWFWLREGSRHTVKPAEGFAVTATLACSWDWDVCRCPTVSVIPSTTRKWMQSLSGLCVFFNKNAFELNWFLFYENFEGEQTVSTSGQVAQTYLTSFLGNLPSVLVVLVVATPVNAQYHFRVEGSTPASSYMHIHWLEPLNSPGTSVWPVTRSRLSFASWRCFLDNRNSL